MRAYKLVGLIRDCETLEAIECPNEDTYINHKVQNDTSFRSGFISHFALDGLFHKSTEVIPHEGEVSFNAQWLDHDEIRAFYEKNPAILDNLLHPPTPPQPNPPESSDTNMRKYCLIVGVSLLFIVVAYLATKYFSDSESAKASTTNNLK